MARRTYRQADPALSWQKLAEREIPPAKSQSCAPVRRRQVAVLQRRSGAGVRRCLRRRAVEARGSGAPAPAARIPRPPLAERSPRNFSRQAVARVPREFKGDSTIRQRQQRRSPMVATGCTDNNPFPVENNRQQQRSPTTEDDRDEQSANKCQNGGGERQEV